MKKDKTPKNESFYIINYYGHWLYHAPPVRHLIYKMFFSQKSMRHHASPCVTIFFLKVILYNITFNKKYGDAWWRMVTHGKNLVTHGWRTFKNRKSTVVSIISRNNITIRTLRTKFTVLATNLNSYQSVTHLRNSDNQCQNILAVWTKCILLYPNL